MTQINKKFVLSAKKKMNYLWGDYKVIHNIGIYSTFEFPPIFKGHLKLFSPEKTQKFIAEKWYTFEACI